MITNSIGQGSGTIQLPGQLQQKVDVSNLQNTASLSLFSGPPQDLSPLAQLTLSHEMRDISFSENQTSFAYYKDDGSMAMRASSTTDVQLHEEKISIDLTLSAEFLGLTAKDFEESGGKPLKFQFSLQQSEINLHYSYSDKTVQTLRKPEEIIYDLAKSINKLIASRGNHKLSVVLDKEAIQALLSSDGTRALYMHIMTLLSLINNLAAMKGAREHNVIQVSGKGKPYRDIQQETSIEGKKMTLELNLTINPPDSQEKTGATTASEPAQPIQENAKVDLTT